MFYLRPSGTQFVDRGEVSSFDYLLFDFVRDEAYHDLDLSEIVGVGKRLVMLQIMLRALTVGCSLIVVSKAYTSHLNSDAIWSIAEGYTNERCLWVITDNNGVVSYMFSAGTFNLCNIIVRGWYKL